MSSYCQRSFFRPLVDKVVLLVSSCWQGSFICALLLTRLCSYFCLWYLINKRLFSLVSHCFRCSVSVVTAFVCHCCKGYVDIAPAFSLSLLTWLWLRAKALFFLSYFLPDSISMLLEIICQHQSISLMSFKHKSLKLNFAECFLFGHDCDGAFLSWVWYWPVTRWGLLRKRWKDRKAKWVHENSTARPQGQDAGSALDHLHMSLVQR